MEPSTASPKASGYLVTLFGTNLGGSDVDRSSTSRFRIGVTSAPTHVLSTDSSAVVFGQMGVGFVSIGSTMTELGSPTVSTSTQLFMYTRGAFSQQPVS